MTGGSSREPADDVPDIPEHLVGGSAPTVPRPGYGIRRPDLVELLAPLVPASVERHVWGDGEVPGDLVSSVRCLVRVGTRLVVCQTPNGPHLLPGGRRSPGETYTETVCREVHEETGFLLEPGDLSVLGFLHFRHLQPVPAGHPHLHPDFLQVVYTAPAHARDVAQGDTWVDLDGWEQGYELLTQPALERLRLPLSERVFAGLVHLDGF